MKSKLQKILKLFSHYRDWVLILLGVAGVVFFLQKSQAIEKQNPEDLWKKKYGEINTTFDALPGGEGMQGGMGMGMGMGMGEAPQPETPAQNPEPIEDDTGEIFPNVGINDIDSISLKPIFTKADDYTALRIRMEKLREEYSQATEEGDTATAVEILIQYCRDDPKGTITSWETEPQQVLQNLVCEEITNSLAASVAEARAVREQLSQLEQGDPVQALEKVDLSLARLNHALVDAENNPDCDARQDDAKDLTETFLLERQGLNTRLVQLEYADLIMNMGDIDPDASAETVAQAVQKLRSFRQLLADRDAEKTILNQSQLDRLDELEKKVESSKESRITQVRQSIATLTAEVGYEENKESLEQILRKFDVLIILDDPKAPQERKKYEGLLKSLVAAETVAKMAGMLDDLETNLDRLEEALQDGINPREIQKTVTDTFLALESSKKDMGRVSRGDPNASAVQKRLRKAKRAFRHMTSRLNK